MNKKKISKKFKVAELEAGWQRCQADFDNFRKRTEEEKLQWQGFARSQIVLDLLPVVDNFELALSHITSEQKNDPTLQGIFHIQKQLMDVLTGYGISKIPVKSGDKFSESIHEAVDSKSGKGGDTIDKVLKDGYKIGDKVLRPTKVTVR